MKLHILSDLHNELYRIDPAPEICTTDADVIILAGDINKGPDGVKWAVSESKRLNKPVIYIAGNHEYYGYEYWSNLNAMQEIAKGTEVHFLECDEWMYQGVRFLGCTLWTDFMVTGNKEDAMQTAKQGMNDYRRIAINDVSTDEINQAVVTRALEPKDTLLMHNKSVKWLKNKLNEDFEGKTVLITHHGPSKTCQHPKYGVDHISASFYSDLEYLFDPVDIWIYGHTHSCLDIKVDSTRLISNQRGYEGYEYIHEFNDGFVVEV